MVQRKQRVHSNCPRCNSEDEHLHHVLTCRSSTTILLRLDLITELSMWLKAVKTQSNIANFIRKGLKTWLEDPSYEWGEDSAIFTRSGKHNTAFQSQIRIG